MDFTNISCSFSDKLNLQKDLIKIYFCVKTGIFTSLHSGVGELDTMLHYVASLAGPLP